MAARRSTDAFIDGKDNEAGWILIPLDRSKRDAVALDYGKRLAGALGVRLAVVTVVPEIRTLLPRAKRLAQSYVDVVARRLQDEGFTAQAFCETGDPSPRIVELGRRLPAELIVMCSRGRTGMSKIALGSVADAVLSKSPIPVLLLAAKATGQQIETSEAKLAEDAAERCPRPTPRPFWTFHTARS